MTLPAGAPGAAREAEHAVPLAHGINTAIVAAGLAGILALLVPQVHERLVGAHQRRYLREREQQALELNDAVLQGLVVAKMALDLDQPRRANDALSASIQSASRIITDLLGSSHASLDLLRSVPAAAGAPAESAGNLDPAADARPERAPR